MLACGRDGRHFRAFINDQDYVRGVLDRLKGQTRAAQTEDGAAPGTTPSESFGADLERRSGGVER